MTDTVLSLSTGLTNYSARGLTQTLEPIDAVKSQRRTVNGKLVDLAGTQFRLYKSSISCSDMNTPPFQDVWPGSTVVVDCVCEISYVTSGGSPSRTVVSGSSRVDGSHTFYRPQLTMMVMSHTVNRDEWGAVTGWQLELEEVQP